MRKLKLQMNMSVDGFVAGPNNELDWMTVDVEGIGEPVFAAVNDLINTSDAIVMGRGMVKEFTTFWEDVFHNQPEHSWHRFAQKMVETPKIAFSRTVTSMPGENLTMENGDLVEKINELRDREGKDLLVYGGAGFASSVIEHNLLDELHLFVQPIAIGEGKGIFTGRTKLQLIASQPNPSGIVINTYVPSGD